MMANETRHPHRELAETRQRLECVLAGSRILLPQWRGQERHGGDGDRQFHEAGQDQAAIAIEIAAGHSVHSLGEGSTRGGDPPGNDLGADHLGLGRARSARTRHRPRRRARRPGQERPVRRLWREYRAGWLRKTRSFPLSLRGRGGRIKCLADHGQDPGHVFRHVSPQRGTRRRPVTAPAERCGQPGAVEAVPRPERRLARRPAPAR